MYVGWETWIRTTIHGVRVRCPTIERSPSGFRPRSPRRKENPSSLDKSRDSQYHNPASFSIWKFFLLLLLPSDVSAPEICEIALQLERVLLPVLSCKLPD